MPKLKKHTPKKTKTLPGLKSESHTHSQMVIIGLDDDTTICFSGPAQIWPGDTRKIKGIKFLEPVLNT